MSITEEEHIKKHKELHKALDELVADFVTQTSKLLSQTSVMALLEWAHKQTVKPS